MGTWTLVPNRSASHHWVSRWGSPQVGFPPWISSLLAGHFALLLLLFFLLVSWCPIRRGTVTRNFWTLPLCHLRSMWWPQCLSKTKTVFLAPAHGLEGTVLPGCAWRLPGFAHSLPKSSSCLLRLSTGRAPLLFLFGLPSTERLFIKERAWAPPLGNGISLSVLPPFDPGKGTGRSKPIHCKIFTDTLNNEKTVRTQVILPRTVCYIFLPCICYYYFLLKSYTWNFWCFKWCSTFVSETNELVELGEEWIPCTLELTLAPTRHCQADRLPRSQAVMRRR